MKRLQTLIIFTVICLSVFCLSVTAQEVISPEYKIDILSPSASPRYPSDLNVELLGSRYSATQTADILRDYLAERLMNMENYRSDLSLGSDNALHISLSKLKGVTLYSNAEGEAILFDALNNLISKNPELFWCDDSYSYIAINGKITEIELSIGCGTDFSVSDGLNPVIEKVNSLKNEFYGYVKSITKLIPDSYSDYEKVLFVNDYLCSNYKYDISIYTNPYSAIYDAFNFFKTGTGVCQAYSLSFMAIMDDLGIRSDFVSADEMNHAWNLVELNNKWYHIDVTWNDPTLGSYENDTFGCARHNYFLLSSECMMDSNHQHYGFDISDYGYVIGNEYDDVEVNTNQSFRSSFVELNGVWYNTAYNASNHTCGLFAFDSPIISDITSEEISSTPLLSIPAWGYTGSFSYLEKYNDAVFFNTRDTIYMFDGTELIELCAYMPEYSECIYGFDIVDNTIRIQVSDGPNSSDMRYGAVFTVDIADLLGSSFSVKDYDKTTNEVTVYSTLNADATLIFASFDKNNRMIDCKSAICSGNDRLISGTRKYNAPADFNRTGADKIKVMLWDNLLFGNPLCSSLTK